MCLRGSDGTSQLRLNGGATAAACVCVGILDAKGRIRGVFLGINVSKRRPVIAGRDNGAAGIGLMLLWRHSSQRKSLLRRCG